MTHHYEQLSTNEETMDPEFDHALISSVWSNKSTKELEKMQVGLRLRIDQIESIDTVNQIYKVRATLDMDWEASNEDIELFDEIKSSKHSHEIEYTSTDLPRVDPVNVVDKKMIYRRWANGDEVKLVTKNGIRYNWRRIELSCVWTKEFIIEHFPFDVQSLTFIFQPREMKRSQLRVFVPSRLFYNCFVIEATCLSTNGNWKFEHVDVNIQMIDWGKRQESAAEENLEEKQQNEMRQLPRICFRLQMKRNWHVIVVRFVIWMFCLAALSLVSFLLQETDKIFFTSNLIVAFAIFQLVVNSLIPNFGFLTMVDWYNITTFVFLCIVVIGHGIILNYDDEEENYFYQGTLVIFFCWQLMFFVNAYASSRRETRKIGQSEEELQKMGAFTGKSLYYSTKNFDEDKNNKIKMDTLMNRN
eukprot:443138_1